MPKEVYHAYAYVRKGRGGGSYPGGPVAGLEGRPDRAGVRRDDHGRLDQESRCMCGRPDQGPPHKRYRSRIQLPRRPPTPDATQTNAPTPAAAAHCWNSAIERGEQVETSSLSDSIDDEATRGLRDRGAYCLSC